MALPGVFNGSQLLILIGDGATPEVFEHKCLINTSRGIQFSSSSSQTPIPDCDNPEDPAWMATDIDGLMAAISGAGKADKGSLTFFYAWFVSGAAKNCKVKVNVPDGVTWSGAFKCTDMGLQAGDRQEKAEGSVALVSDGVVTLAANS